MRGSNEEKAAVEGGGDDRENKTNQSTQVEMLKTVFPSKPGKREDFLGSQRHLSLKI